MNFKTSLTEYIERRMADLLAMHNPDGSFGAYPYSNAQYPFYTMAFAFKKMPQTPWHGSAQLQAALIRTLEYYYNLVDEDGKTEFYGAAGSKWGKTLAGGWPLFCWQEALRLLESDLPHDLFLRHQEKILKIITIHFDEINKTMTANPDPFKIDVHNLFVWRALMLYRAGILWQNEAWKKLGTNILRKAVQAQNPDGWWSEGGPIAGYNLVTATAISLYCEWNGDQDALKAMEKSARYHDTFAYPDGTMIETIDGRMRYHPHVMPYIPPSFSRFPEGRAYLERVLQTLSKEQVFEVPNIQGFSFFGFICEHLTDTPQPDTVKSGMTRVLPALHSAVIRQGGWCCALCGYENITHMGGFRLERQNLLSVWHEKTGLILGGGHSNFQPEFSCFNVIDRKGILHYLHANSQIQAQDNEMKLTMTYGGLPVSLSVQILDERRVQVRYGVESFTDKMFSRFMVRANLILIGHPGVSVRCEKHKTNLDEKSLSWTEEDFGNGIEHNGWRLQIPKRSESVAVKWPFYPYNSYRMDRKSELKTAAIIASAQLSLYEPVVEYEIEIL